MAEGFVGIITAVAVTAFVMKAMRKMVSRRIGALPPTWITPTPAQRFDVSVLRTALGLEKTARR